MTTVPAPARASEALTRDGVPGARIIEVCGSAAGGVRAHLAECSRLLAAQGDDVLTLAPAAVLEGVDLGTSHGSVLEIGASPRLSDLRSIASLRRLGRSADVVHAHGLRAGALAVLALGLRRDGRTRLVVTLHNLPVGPGRTRAVGAALERLVAAGADHVLAVSPDLATRAQERGARRVDLAVIPAPARRATDEQGAPARGREPQGDSESPWGQGPRVLTIARLAPQKGMDLLLDAAALLSAQPGGGQMLTTLTWAVAGEGPLRGDLEARIASEDLPVRLLGHRQDVAELAASADVVVQTSVWEGQPLTLQEALREGTAVVATDVGGTSVTVRGGAVLVPVRAQAVADAVGLLLRDPQARRMAQDRARAAAQTLPGPQELLVQLREVLLDGAGMDRSK